MSIAEIPQVHRIELLERLSSRLHVELFCLVAFLFHRLALLPFVSLHQHKAADVLVPAQRDQTALANSWEAIRSQQG